jgi:hypothetical protein
MLKTRLFGRLYAAAQRRARVRFREVAHMQIWAFFASVLLVSAIGAGPAIASTLPAAIIVAAAPAMFDVEAAAQTHGLRDVVVWLTAPTGVYHEKGMRWYGRTKHGAFVCKKEADAAGDRDTRNGQ